MLKKDYHIIKEFLAKPWGKFTFKEIKRLSGKKSESYVHASLKKFVKEGILLEQKIGNSILYSLNLNSLKTLNYIGFVSEYIGFSKKNMPREDLERVALKIPTNLFILIVTGSYAKGIQERDSDIDIVIICDDCLEPKKIYSELKHDCDMTIPPMHLYVFKQEEFLNMLIDSKMNYGKEIANNNLIIFGGEEYYKIIGEAIKHGFNG